MPSHPLSRELSRRESLEDTAVPQRFPQRMRVFLAPLLRVPMRRSFDSAFGFAQDDSCLFAAPTKVCEERSSGRPKVAPTGLWGKMARPRADFTVPKPPSEREGDRDSGGRSLRNFNIRNCCFLRILPQSPSAPVSDPGHKHGLLPALAKNMPQAYFLNASRPLGGSLTHRRRFADILSTQRPKPPCKYRHPERTHSNRITKISQKEKSGMFSFFQGFYYKYAWFFRIFYKIFSTVFHILWKTLWIIYQILIFFYRFVLKIFHWLD